MKLKKLIQSKQIVVRKIALLLYRVLQMYWNIKVVLEICKIVICIFFVEIYSYSRTVKCSHTFEQPCIRFV